MSIRPSETSSPSNSEKPTTSAPPQDFSETPQATAAAPPLITITDSSPPLHHCSLTNRHPSGTHSSPQTPLHETSPLRPRSHSQPGETQTTNASMSSASSSPGNTSTAGSTSGSNPGYQLPYAPFPYPMPANTRGSGQGQGK